MYLEILKGIMLPFLGTSLGAMCVFFMRKDLNKSFKKCINGFAGGVMIAASVWSLLIPAMEYESSKILGKFSFLPASIGLWLGIIFLILCDKLLPNFENDSLLPSENKLMFLSVTLHNLPEGMAVGVVYAAMLASQDTSMLSGALALSLGIAVQNFPEGAIVSMPLAGTGMKKHKAFLYGIFSGIVEPIGAVITLLSISYILPFLPYLLGFAAGAMIYVVVKELIPIIIEDETSTLGIIFYALGFSFMMILDVALG